MVRPDEVFVEPVPVIRNVGGGVCSSVGSGFGRPCWRGRQRRGKTKQTKSSINNLIPPSTNDDLSRTWGTRVSRCFPPGQNTNSRLFHLKTDPLWARQFLFG